MSAVEFKVTAEYTVTGIVNVVTPSVTDRLVYPAANAVTVMFVFVLIVVATAVLLDVTETVPLALLRATLAVFPNVMFNWVVVVLSKFLTVTVKEATEPVLESVTVILDVPIAAPLTVIALPVRGELVCNCTLTVELVNV